MRQFAIFMFVALFALIIPIKGICSAELEQLKAKAAKGNVSAQVEIGILYVNGTGVRQDYAEAMKWYLKAAEQGFANAQYNIGIFYANGHGVRQDVRIAKEWFGKACDNGNQVGCDKYKVLNEKGY